MVFRSLYIAEGYSQHIFLIILLGLGYFKFLLIAESVSVFFQISALTGQLIVNKFLVICSFLFDIFKLTCSFFEILYEDSLIFIKDAIEKLVFAIYLLKELYMFLEEFGWNLLSAVYTGLLSIFSFLEFLQYALGTVKQGIHHSGSAIWHFFTSIPHSLILSANAINEFIKNAILEIGTNIYDLHQKFIDSFRKTYLFLFDVPFDSVCRLTIGAVLVILLCVKFKTVCYITSKVLLKLFQAFSATISFLNKNFLELKTTRCVECSKEDNERLCIVCQCLPKEIIIFPCKHLCLCTDCNRKIINNQAMCPLCRGDITGTLKVYV